MNNIGPLLKTWRGKRRLSQLDLALEAGVSTRHLSFVETGRARPSEQMVLHLAEQLDVPLRERNRMLLAAGYAPVYAHRNLEEPELGPVKEALDQLLKSHEPFPAIVVDRGWNLVAANRAIEMLTAGAAAHLLQPPVNALRLALHPEGMAPRIVNFGEWRAHLLRDLAAQADVSGDDALIELHDELRAYPGEDGEPGLHDVFVPLRIRGPHDTELRFLSTRTTFATAVDVTVAELAIESFFPADEQTANAIRATADSARR
jgi:transcriptional regulator with XRE-family HTH domain